MIVIPILEFEEATEYQRIQKIKEECTEVQMAHAMKESTERKLEECYDLLETTITYMHKIADGVEIEKAGAAHYTKMLNRGYKIKGVWEVTKV